MADDVEKEIKAAQAKRKLITEEDISQAVLNNEKHASLTDEENEDDDLYQETRRKLNSYTASKEFLNEAVQGADSHDPFAASMRERTIAGRQNEYQQRRFNRMLSPTRKDAFSENNDTESRSYSEVAREVELEKEEQRVLSIIAQKKKQEAETGVRAEVSTEAPKKKRRWDVATPVQQPDATPVATVKRSRWDATPARPNDLDATPVRKSEWDDVEATPKATTKRSRWDATPVANNVNVAATPVGGMGMMTPTPSQMYLTPEASNALRWERELDARYEPIRTPARKLTATPTPMGETGFVMQDEVRAPVAMELPQEIPGVGTLPFFKEEDMQHFDQEWYSSYA
ncbi:Putative Splicing factor 3B subunit 1 [Rhizopus microsporus]|nr:Putative Splicing factor 3B subunit 1 [Rhizopus microsporus]